MKKKVKVLSEKRAQRMHEDGTCNCGSEESAGTCPYSSDVHGKEHECNCCVYKQKQCALDI